MGVVLSNNVFSFLIAPILAGDTEIAVMPGDAGLFPALAPGDYAYATISSPGPPVLGIPSVVIEVVKITERTGNVLQVVRGQDDTTAWAFPEGAVVALRINAASVMDAFPTNFDYLMP